MTINHPLTFIPNQLRKPLFWAALALTLGLFAVFRVLNAPLTTSTAPGGIVSFELAGTVKKAAAIMDSWDAKAGLFAAFGLGLDYLFMASYAIALALGILLAAGRHDGLWIKIVAWLGWGMFAAALFDAVENFALLKLLIGSRMQIWPRLAYWSATAKFGLLIIGLGFALAAWLWPRRK
jgi:hypothetical protein